MPRNWQQTVPSLWHPHLLVLWHTLADKVGHLEQRKRKSRGHQVALKLRWGRTEILSGPDGRVFLQHTTTTQNALVYGNDVTDGTLAGVAQWTECWPANQRVVASIPALIPGLGARSPVGGTREATTHGCFSPSLSPCLPLSLKINK